MPSVHREPLPPHGDEVYRRVTRPDLPATTAVARTMDPRGPHDDEPTHPGSSFAPTVELKKVSPAPRPPPPSSVHEEQTVPGQVRADLLYASASEQPTAPVPVKSLAAEAEELALTRPITNPGALYTAHLEKPTSPGLPAVPPAAPAPRAANEAVPAAPPKRAAVWSATGAVVEIHARAAPLWRRTLALGVDSCLQALLVAGIVSGLVFSGKVGGLKLAPTALTGLDAFMLRLHASPALLTAGGAVIVLTAFTYSALFAVLWQGRSPGRRLAGIRLVDARGAAPSPVRALVRAGLALVSFALLMAGFWLSLFDRRGQTLHDRLTSTFVVRPS